MGGNVKGWNIALQKNCGAGWMKKNIQKVMVAEEVVSGKGIVMEKGWRA